jgi:hypothetical protein
MSGTVLRLAAAVIAVVAGCSGPRQFAERAPDSSIVDGPGNGEAAPSPSNQPAVDALGDPDSKTSMQDAMPDVLVLSVDASADWPADLVFQTDASIDRNELPDRPDDLPGADMMASPPPGCVRDTTRCGPGQGTIEVCQDGGWLPGPPCAGSCVDGRCQKKAAGQACEDSSECQTGFCADGACCLVPKCDLCRQCGAEGRCEKRIPAGTEDPVNGCFSRRACDANGQCRTKLNEPCKEHTECMSGYCGIVVEQDSTFRRVCLTCGKQGEQCCPTASPCAEGTVCGKPELYRMSPDAKYISQCTPCGGTNQVMCCARPLCLLSYITGAPPMCGDCSF